MFIIRFSVEATHVLNIILINENIGNEIIVDFSNYNQFPKKYQGTGTFSDSSFSDMRFMRMKKKKRR